MYTIRKWTESQFGLFDGERLAAVLQFASDGSSRADRFAAALNQVAGSPAAKSPQSAVLAGAAEILAKGEQGTKIKGHVGDRADGKLVVPVLLFDHLGARRLDAEGRVVQEAIPAHDLPKQLAFGFAPEPRLA